jgi:hypothetical protein
MLEQAPKIRGLPPDEIERVRGLWRSRVRHGRCGLTIYQRHLHRRT